MRKYYYIPLTVILVLLTSAQQCQAGRGFRGVPPPHVHTYRGGGGWEWIPFTLGLLGIELLLDMNRQQQSTPDIIEQPPQAYEEPTLFGPKRPVIVERPPQAYVEPAPEEPTEPAYWYYCEESDAYYPYVKHCPRGWEKQVPIPPPPPEDDLE